MSASRHRDRLAGLLGAGREVAAFARQATLLPRDVGTIVPRDVAPGSDVVVFLHGLFASAGVLRPLRSRVEARTNARTASFSYAPGPGVERVAERLARLVARLPPGARVHLVGHSMGGVVARWFAQEHPGAGCVVQTISLASPFQGTSRARLLPAGAGRDITPRSELLGRLVERARETAHLPHLSIVAGRDSVVDAHAALPVGEVIVVQGVGHNALLYEPSVAEAVADRIAGRRSVPSAA